MMMVMINNTRFHIIFFILLLTAGDSLYGQRKDFQSWFEAEFSKGLTNDLDISAEVEQRFKYNSTTYDRTMITIGAEYDVNNYLEVAGGIRMLMASDIDSRVNPRSRIHGDVTGGISRWSVDFSLRARLQYGFEDVAYFADFRKNTLRNRYRLKAAHHIFGTRFGVYGTAELWGIMTGYGDPFFNRMRYSVGGSYSINLQSEVSLRYIREDEYNQVSPMHSNIIVFGYAHSF
jgi:hypothetical protein